MGILRMHNVLLWQSGGDAFNKCNGKKVKYKKARLSFDHRANTIRSET